MKLAVISDEVSQDFDRVIAFAQEFGLDGIEIRSVDDKPPHKQSDEDVDRIAAKMRDAGLEVTGIASPVLKCDVRNEAEVAEHIEIFKRCIELAKRWNAPLIRVFTGWRNTDDPQAQYPLVAKIFREQLLPLVENENIRLGIENEYSTNVGDGDEVVAFFKELGPTDKVTLVWDPCNILYMPGPTDSLKIDYPKVKELIGHFHVKDSKRLPADQAKEQPAESTAVGDGEVQIRQHLETLARDGYDGWVSLETHWRMNKVLTEKEANLPMGAAFSSGAEPASRECMTRLKSWVEALS